MVEVIYAFVATIFVNKSIQRMQPFTKCAMWTRFRILDIFIEAEDGQAIVQLICSNSMVEFL